VRVVESLRASKPVLAAMARDERLTIAGARYDLDTGAVEWLP
jgi:carbonic anhydrase